MSDSDYSTVDSIDTPPPITCSRRTAANAVTVRSEVVSTISNPRYIRGGISISPRSWFHVHRHTLYFAYRIRHMGQDYHGILS